MFNQKMLLGCIDSLSIVFLGVLELWKTELSFLTTILGLCV